MNRIHGIRTFAGAFALLAALAFSGAASAQDASGVQIKTAAFQKLEVKADDGSTRTELVPVARVVPGDEVVYEISYANNGSEAASDIAINSPIPAELAFVETVNPPTAVSVDKGETFGALGDLVVEAEDGSLRPAQPADITHLRWTIATLAPGASGKVVYRVIVK